MKIQKKKREIFDNKNTAIVNLGASGWYFTPDAPLSKVDAQASKIRVGTATGQPQVSTASCELPIKGIPTGIFGHIMPSFHHNLLGIGVLCDKDCKVIFTKRSVIIYDKDKKPFLTGCREIDRAKLWRISLKLDLSKFPPCPKDPGATQEGATFEAYSTYDLPSVEAFVKYFHTAAGYPVRSTWLTAIKAGNFKTWPGLTYNNVRHYCPSSDETLKGHMVQTRQNIRSTKLKETQSDIVNIQFKQQFTRAGYGSKTKRVKLPDIEKPPPRNKSVNKLHVNVLQQIKFYTDDTRRFPTDARSGNQYVKVAYHSSNFILFEPFASRKDKHRLTAYNVIMQRLKEKISL